MRLLGQGYCDGEICTRPKRPVQEVFTQNPGFLDFRELLHLRIYLIMISFIYKEGTL